MPPSTLGRYLRLTTAAVALVSLGLATAHVAWAQPATASAAGPPPPAAPAAVPPASVATPAATPAAENCNADTLRRLPPSTNPLDPNITFPAENRLRPRQTVSLPVSQPLTDVRVCFVGRGIKPTRGGVRLVGSGSEQRLEITAPRFVDLNAGREWRFLEPTALISYRLGTETMTARWQVEVFSPNAAALGAVVFLLAALGLTWLLLLRPAKGRHPRATPDTPAPSPIAQGLLGLITSPNNRLSLSLAQVGLWTIATVFGFVYIWLMSETVLELSSETLMLLGISVGTAVGGKVQTVSRLAALPAEAQEYARKDGHPEASDLITANGLPSLMKFQMLAFTVIAVVAVLWEIIEKFRFPVLNSQLVILMGVSGAAYLGNQGMSAVTVVEIERKLAELRGEKPAPADRAAAPADKTGETAPTTAESSAGTAATPREGDQKARETIKGELRDMVAAYLA